LLRWNVPSLKEDSVADLITQSSYSQRRVFITIYVGKENQVAFELLKCGWCEFTYALHFLKITAGCQCLMPTILATQEKRLEGSWFKASQANSLPISKNPSQK
jgi:hypothetical protein